MGSKCLTGFMSLSALLCCIGLMSGSTSADIEIAQWDNPAAWKYKIKFMPDFDQRRVGGKPFPGAPFVFGLPGDPEEPLSGGGMYCVPTSAYDLMAYIANHGFPEVAPGPNSSWYWESDVPYNDVTFDLIDMGVLMETDPMGGTSGSGGEDGIDQWLADSGALGKFTVTHHYFSSNSNPTLTSMGASALNGSVIMFGYGRYENNGQTNGVQLIGERTSGHAMVFVHGERAGFSQIIGSRDPADDPDAVQGLNFWLYTQSPFSIRYLDVNDKDFVKCFGLDCIQTGSFLNYDPDGEKVFLIDVYTGIRPKQGYAWVNSDELSFIMLLTPSLMQGSYVLPVTQVELPKGLDAQQVVPMPDFDGFFVICADADSEKLISVDTLSGATSTIATIEGALGLTVGENRLIYVVTENELLCLNSQIDDGSPVTASALLPEPADAVAFNDTTDDVVVLSATDRVLMFYHPEIPAGKEPTMQDLPPDVVLGDQVSMSVEPGSVGDRIWLASNAAPFVYALRKGMPDYVEAVPIPDGVLPTSASVDDAGHLFVNTEKGLVEFMFTGAGGWMPVSPDNAEFAEFDLPAGAPFHVTTSRSNRDPVLHSLPGWTTNISPDELLEGEIVIDCPADFDDDNMVGVSDLLAVLAAWGPCDICIMDLDENREIGAGDLLQLLADWGPCD